MTRICGLLLMVVCGCTVGCRPSEPTSGATPAATAKTAVSTAAQQDQQQVALAARDAMSGRLLDKLTEVLGASGPVAAIEVCRQRAPEIAAETGQKLGVAIGRTSFRLRNPQNTPPEWARSLIEARPTDPRFIPFAGQRAGSAIADTGQGGMPDVSWTAGPDLAGHSGSAPDSLSRRSGYGLSSRGPARLVLGNRSRRGELAAGTLIRHQCSGLVSSSSRYW